MQLTLHYILQKPFAIAAVVFPTLSNSSVISLTRLSSFAILGNSTSIISNRPHKHQLKQSFQQSLTFLQRLIQFRIILQSNKQIQFPIAIMITGNAVLCIPVENPLMIFCSVTCFGLLRNFFYVTIFSRSIIFADKRNK